MSKTTIETEATEHEAARVSDADSTEEDNTEPRNTEKDNGPGSDTEEEAEPDDTDQDDAADDQQPDGKASREAAKYRRQLRSVEAERDELAEQIKTMRAAIAEEAITSVLAMPSSLWLTGADAADFFDTDGNLDTEALEAAARQAVKDHGLQPHRRFHGSADGGVREAAAVPRRFADMFKPAS